MRSEPTIPAFALYTWESQVCQYAKVGPPGIRLETYEPDGSVTVIANSFGGKRLPGRPTRPRR